MNRLGIPILPNVSGAQNPVFHSGWSVADPAGFVWIEGAAGDLVLELPPLINDLLLEIDCFPMELTGASPQRLTAFCGGTYLGAKLLRSRQTVSFTILREMCTGRQIRVSLVPAVVEIPKLAGRNVDERALSVGIYSICLRNAQSVAA